MLAVHASNVCVECSLSLGRLILAADTARLETLWVLRHPTAQAAAGDDAMQRAQQLEVNGLREVVRELRNEAGGALDAVTCAKVASALFEMDLRRDALVSAAAALRMHPSAPVIDAALQIVLHPALLKPQSIRTLREWLYPS
jgi:hypothetical protein